MADSLQLVVFSLENKGILYEYGIPIGTVHEITRQEQILPMPGTAPFVEGIMNLRGKVIPIIDVKKRFHMGTTIEKESTRIMIMNINGNKCGIMVDDVKEIISVDPENMEEPPEVAGGIEGDYILGIAKVNERMIIALDITKILTESVVQHPSAS